MPFGWEMSLCLKKDFAVKDIWKEKKNQNKIHKWGEVCVEESLLGKLLALSEAG